MSALRDASYDDSMGKALSAEGSPTLTTVHKVLAAVGLRVSVVPAHE